MSPTDPLLLRSCLALAVAPRSGRDGAARETHPGEAPPDLGECLVALRKRKPHVPPARRRLVKERVAWDRRHAYLFDPKTAPTGRVRAFYVVSGKGDFGLVPWPGATIIWPWEKAWEQDLWHEQQTPEKQAHFKAFADAYKKKDTK